MRDLNTTFLALILIVNLSGCGYTFGVVARENVRKVAVPVFENKTLRRAFEKDLTFAVQREIKETLPYLLSLEDDADLTLKGTILSINESVLVEGRDDQVLEGLIQITVQVQLFDRMGNLLPITRQASDNQAMTQMVLTDQAEFVLSRGETRDTATREAIKEMAERIAQILAGPPSIKTGP
ncbi:MAG: LptE family protein [Planctomycetota bacterium]|nr:LptE family protein [Planctomycetota bacterium]